MNCSFSEEELILMLFAFFLPALFVITLGRNALLVVCSRLSKSLLELAIVAALTRDDAVNEADIWRKNGKNCIFKFSVPTKVFIGTIQGVYVYEFGNQLNYRITEFFEGIKDRLVLSNFPKLRRCCGKYVNDTPYLRFPWK